jgi:spore coat polysaccharide biosynthesis predicted glycosyltransferase SpsG
VTVLIRCDATEQTGLGHLGRCVALAEALRAMNAESVFSGTFLAPGQDMLADAGFEARPALDWHELGHASERASGVIVDSYKAQPADLRYVEPGRIGCPLLVIDDYGRLCCLPDHTLVLNFTALSGLIEYQGVSVEVLRGPGYVPMRRALRLVRESTTKLQAPPRRVLVSIGGTDRHGASRRVVASLRRVAPQITPILVGASSQPTLPTGETWSTSRGLAELLAGSDAVVTGGGLSKYEAGYTGRPAAVLAQTLDEHHESQRFAEAGLGVLLGAAADVSDEDLDRGLLGYLTDRAGFDRMRRACLEAMPTHSVDRVAAALVSRMAGGSD